MRIALDDPGQPAPLITPEHVFVLVGIALFARWLLRTSLGRKSLVDSPDRPNRMLPFTPFIPFFLWFVGIALMQAGVEWFMGTMTGWQGRFLDQLIFCAGAVFTIVVILTMAKFTFTDGLHGFGLRLRTVPKDFGQAIVTLLAVWPVVLATIVATTMLGKMFSGPEFQIPQHEGLRIVTESPALPLRVLIVLLAVVVAPVLEEMLFRGLFQTMVRSYTENPWLAIIIASAIFASVHQDVSHWPALFALAMGLGYSYERSGSLTRPIVMHAIFNAIAIGSVLYETPAWT
jgi:membrane protease YdiL (CAAX protease family)